MCGFGVFTKISHAGIHGFFSPSLPLNRIPLQTTLGFLYVRLRSLLQNLTYQTLWLLLPFASPGSLFSNLNRADFMCGSGASSKVLTSIPMFLSLLLLLSTRSLSKVSLVILHVRFWSLPLKVQNHCVYDICLFLPFFAPSRKVSQK
jgi:hypothetical protein